MGKRKLTVTSISQITTFTNKRGNPSTLYEVYALGEDGEPIDLPLRSFEELPQNELIEVDVERYFHEKHGESYTLSTGRGGGGSGGGSPSPGARLGPKVDELRDRLDEIERRVARLESGATSPVEGSSSKEEIPW